MGKMGNATKTEVNACKEKLKKEVKAAMFFFEVDR